MPSYFFLCIRYQDSKTAIHIKKAPNHFFSLFTCLKIIHSKKYLHPPHFYLQENTQNSIKYHNCFSSSSLGEGKNVLRIPMYSLTDPGQMSKWLRVCFWCRFSHLRYPKNIPKSQCLISCSRCHCAPIWALVKQDQEKVYQNPFACYLVN